MNTQVKKQAEEYASIKCLKIESNIPDKFNKRQLYYAYLQGYQDALRWRSPDEKPERHDKYRSITILFVKDEIYYLGIYDYDAKEWIPEGMAQGFKNIDKWQYLPE